MIKKNNITKLSILTAVIVFLSLSFIFAGRYFSFSNKAQAQTNCFSGLHKDTYYWGNIHNKDVFVKFDSLSDKYISGKYFIVDDNIYADKKDFEIIKKRRYYVLSTDDFEKEIRFNFSSDYESISGNYSINKRFLRIFNRFSKDYEFDLDVYKSPKFIQYPNRYKEPVFDSVVVEKDVIYGQERGYWASYMHKGDSYWRILEQGMARTIRKRDLLLNMDIYYPADDTLKYTPLIMFIHGGGFYIGDKASKALKKWSKYLAKSGYTVASINYRIGFKPVNNSIERAAYRAVQDAHAAMRFLVFNREKYGIDTSKLFVAGTSAGGITALNLAFMTNETRPESSYRSFLLPDLGNIEETTNSYAESFDIKTVINMWGAVGDIDVINNNPNVSILSFHGIDDMVVPYFYDYPFKDIRGPISRVVFNKMYGSFLIHQRAEELGMREKLFTFNGYGHTPHICRYNYNELTDNFYLIKNEMLDFLYPEILPKTNTIIADNNAKDNEKSSVYYTQINDIAKIHWKVEGGFIVNNNKNSIRVIWLRNASKYSLSLSVLHNNGASSSYRINY